MGAISPNGSACRWLSEEEESSGGALAARLPVPSVHWERILRVRTLKVLLVEDDDSTRHVVSALLRNCSYEVTTAANGLQAWNILENPLNRTDIILTEVVMPGLSGIGLLCKIMSHDTCKNIPVIMMSSNDSMGMVFKCLSKGAVDFLVKPIRKNELKNLWQHVWRRSHSSSGSASESGIQTHKSTKPGSEEGSGNNNDINADDENASVGLNVRGGSDNGSGTQSSWTKHAVEVESPRPMSSSDNLADPHDSTCAQFISESEILNNKRVLNKESDEKKQIPDEEMGKDLEIGISKDKKYPTDKSSIKLVETGEKDEERNLFDEPTAKAADLIGGISESPNVERVDDVPESELPSLHLSTKRQRSGDEDGNAAEIDRNVLRRSVQSAFSRYRNSAASTQAPTGYGGSCSPDGNSSEAVKTDSTNNMLSNSNPANGSSDNNDMGSTTKNIFTNPKLVGNTVHTSAFHPVQHLGLPFPKVVQEKTNNAMPPQHHVENIKFSGDVAYYSNSGSNHGSNEQNPVIKAGGPTVEHGFQGNGSGSGSGNCMDQNRFARRAAALNKFRQKRKERNFGKKVRYHSRQKLAEQRPRVKGQFVRQEYTSRETQS